MGEFKVEIGIVEEQINKNLNCEMKFLKGNNQIQIHLESIVGQFKEDFWESNKIIEEIHDFGTIFEAEVKRFKREKSNQESIHNSLLQRLQETERNLDM